MLSYSNQIVGFALNAITIGEIIFAYLISLIIVITIIYHFFRNDIKAQDKTILILCLNIYLSSLVYMSLFFVLNIRTVFGDIYQIDLNSSGCVLLGYVYAVFLCVLYISFINQAFFRLCRIVYSQYRYLQASSLYVLIIPIEVVIAFILSFPIYAWNDIVYLPNYHFCFVPISNIRGYGWIFLTVYGIPVISITCIYVRITRYIKTQTNPSLRVKHRQARDLNAIRGIFIIVGFLLFLGLPTLALMIMMFITGDEHPLTFRITCISIGTSMVGLSLAMMIFVPQLRVMVCKTFKPNPVVVVTDSGSINSTQMRSISSNR